MINRHRIRRILAPTAGLTKAIGMMLLGLLSILLGLGFSFKNVVMPAIQWFAGRVHGGLEKVVPPERIEFAEWLLGGVFLTLGVYLTIRAFRKTVNHIVETLNPGMTGGKMDVYVRRQVLAHGPRIVAMGGGTGLSTLLRGLKHHSSNITAVVTVTDDGGSSGRLIQDKGMIPPGDIRNCLVALSDAEKAMTDLFQHRFRGDSGSLSGHAIGNLLIAAMVDQANGDFEKAVQTASDVLAIRGRVVPATLDHVRLRALFEDGTEACGETKIVETNKRIRKIFLDPENCRAHKGAIEAIRTADLVCIGPGSVYTSVIPNLLVPGIAEALKETKAPKVYICNVMTQPGESDGFTAADHVRAILNCAEARVFDYVLINTGTPSEQALDKYRASGSELVEPDADRIRQMGLRVLRADITSETDVVRHDPMKVVARLLALLNR